jgi:hypothetical protein
MHEVTQLSFTRVVRFFAVLLIVTLLGNNLAYAHKKPLDAPAVKARVESRGVGKGVRLVEVDKTEVQGSIVSIGDQSFVLRPKNSGASVDISYAQVSDIHNTGLSTGAKIGIVAGAAVAAAVIIIVVLYKKNARPL